jgi:hypothetical protein
MRAVVAQVSLRWLRHLDRSPHGRVWPTGVGCGLWRGVPLIDLAYKLAQLPRVGRPIFHGSSGSGGIRSSRRTRMISGVASTGRLSGLRSGYAGAANPAPVGTLPALTRCGAGPIQCFSPADAGLAFRRRRFRLPVCWKNLPDRPRARPFSIPDHDLHPLPTPRLACELIRLALNLVQCSRALRAQAPATSLKSQAPLNLGHSLVRRRAQSGDGLVQLRIMRRLPAGS